MTGGRTDKGLLLLRVRQAEGPLRAVRFLAAPCCPANSRPIVAPSVPSRVIGLQHSTLVNEVNAKESEVVVVSFGLGGGDSKSWSRGVSFSNSQPKERGFGSDCWEQNSFIYLLLGRITHK